MLVLKLEGDDDVTLQNESCEVETASDDEFIDNTEYNESVENYYDLIMFLESIMMELEILFLDLIFHKSQAIIALVMKYVMKWLSLKKSLIKILINPQGDESVDFFLCYFICNQVHLNRKLWSVWEWYQFGWSFWNFFTERNMRLDVDILTFKNQCHQTNNILNKNNLFLRVFELKEKLCSLIKQSLDKKKCYQRIVS